MDLPIFFLCDNTDFPDAIFVLHTEYPRFVINLKNDEIEWLDPLEKENGVDLEKEVKELIDAATSFYDREIARYEKMTD